MNNEHPTDAPQPPPSASPSTPLRRWISLLGGMIAVGSLLCFVMLFALDAQAHFSNPYVGVVIFLVAPLFLFLGLGLLGLGALLDRRARLRNEPGAHKRLVIDFSSPRHRRTFAAVLFGGIFLMALTGFISYYSYHFTESASFCGETCHTVMEPERTTYQHSAHARVACVDCHIGPGATWFVRSKLSGTYQVYATLAGKYPRPIPTPIRNLRPAQVTCEQCHWPKAFVGNLDKTYTHYLYDKSNTMFSVRLLMKVGGADPTHGPVGGIHWHMNVGNRIEYYATDEDRQDIPWIRVINEQSVVTTYRVKNFTNDPPPEAIRRMDCMDCHNRPAHRFTSPDQAVDLAMSLGRIDASMPSIKSRSVKVLAAEYRNVDEAMQKIATTLASEYADHPSLRTTIDAVQEIYRLNFFPEMKADWRVYHDNIGHKIWPGCFRCHDGKHIADDGKRSIKAGDCSSCHIILAQGRGEEMNQLSAKGQPFAHPGGDIEDMLCHECHSGGEAP